MRGASEGKARRVECGMATVCDFRIKTGSTMSTHWFDALYRSRRRRSHLSTKDAPLLRICFTPSASPGLMSHIDDTLFVSSP
uniref:Uncharacterized protein n=1 Tax=Setaria digitata TaxID=48799 RepID=A0A915PLE7_9BILA